MVPVTTESMSFAFTIFSLYAACTMDSLAATNLVPICMPSAPSMNAAAMPRPSAIPPAAITGMLTASTTWGISAKEVVTPIYPPLSIPSATTASAPARSIMMAIAVLATTGITTTPASFQASMNLPGFPAPVVTTLTPSSMMIFATSSALGLRSMTLTPKGLSVSSLHFFISSRTTSAGAEAAPMIPSPPAFDTAAARLCSATHAIPPCMMGYSVFSKSVILFFIFLFLLSAAFLSIYVQTS